MNTNKIKNVKILFLLIFTFLFIPNIVYAKCSGNSESECSTATEDGFKCTYEWHTNSGTCKKSNECASGYTLENGSCIINSTQSSSTQPSNSTQSTTNSSGNVGTSISCSQFNSQDMCSTYGKCRWISGSCQEQYVAQDPCYENDVKKVLKIFGIILMIAKLIVPLLIIGFGTVDLYKSVIDKDEKSLTKQGKMLLIRIIAGVFIFFIPSIVNTIFKMVVDITDNDQYKTCVSCILDPTNTAECDVIDNVDYSNTDNACGSGYVKGIDGLCYRNGSCGSYTDSNTCRANDCAWSARNGCHSK